MCPPTTLENVMNFKAEIRDAWVTEEIKRLLRQAEKKAAKAAKAAKKAAKAAKAAKA